MNELLLLLLLRLIAVLHAVVVVILLLSSAVLVYFPNLAFSLLFNIALAPSIHIARYFHIEIAFIA